MSEQPAAPSARAFGDMAAAIVRGGEAAAEYLTCQFLPLMEALATSPAMKPDALLRAALRQYDDRMTRMNAATEEAAE